MTAGPIRGGCLCGAVRFELIWPFRRANLCHCSRCREHSGGPALAQGRVPREGFRLLAGAGLVETFRPPGGMAKAFCRPRTLGQTRFHTHSLPL